MAINASFCSSIADRDRPGCARVVPAWWLLSTGRRVTTSKPLVSCNTWLVFGFKGLSTKSIYDERLVLNSLYKRVEHQSLITERGPVPDGRSDYLLVLSVFARNRECSVRVRHPQKSVCMTMSELGERSRMHSESLVRLKADPRFRASETFAGLLI